MYIDIENQLEFIQVIQGLAPIPYGGYKNPKIANGRELTKFTGNQWNENWAWSVERLSVLSPNDRERLCDDVLKPININVQGLG